MKTGRDKRAFKSQKNVMSREGELCKDRDFMLEAGPSVISEAPLSAGTFSLDR